MATNAIMVDEGRNALITYNRNSNATPQTNKFYLKEFKLYKEVYGITSQTKTKADLEPKIITDGIFPVADRLNLGDGRLRLKCIVDNSWTSGVDDITAIGVIFETEGSVQGLYGYAIFGTGFNKPAGTNLSFNIDIQF